MPERGFDFKNLDLSKEPDQKKFDEEFGILSEEDRKSLVDAAEEEAVSIELAKEFSKYIAEGDYDSAFEMKDELPGDIIKQIVGEKFIKLLNKGGGCHYIAFDLKNKFSLSDDILYLSKIQQNSREEFTALTKEKQKDADRIEAEKIHFSKEVGEYLQLTEVQDLIEQINNNQDSVEKETSERYENIYKSHFAIHGSHITRNLFAIMRDGVFSSKYALKYNNKIADKRIMKSDFEQLYSQNEQGPGRVSAFSVFPILNALKAIENNNYTNNILYSRIRFFEKDPDAQTTTEEFLNKHMEYLIEFIRNYTGDNTINIKKSVQDISRVVLSIARINMELNKTVQLFSKKIFLENFLSALIDKISYLLSQSGDSAKSKRHKKFKYLYETKNLFFEKFGNSYDLREESIEELEEFVANLQKNKLEEELVECSYDSAWSYVNVLVDANKIEDIYMNKIEQPMLEFDYHNDTDPWAERKYIKKSENEQAPSFTKLEHNMTHRTEFPVFDRIKASSICGLFVNDKKKPIPRAAIEESGNSDKTQKYKFVKDGPLDIVRDIRNIIQRINLERIKDHIDSEDFHYIEAIQQGNNVSNMKLLFLASKICNYNLFKQDLNYEDMVFAIANYYKMPVYNSSGDLVWPKKINHKEVGRFVEEKEKGVDAEVG